MIALILLLALPAAFSQTTCTGGSYSVTCGTGFYCAILYSTPNIGTGGTYTNGASSLIPSGGSITSSSTLYYSTAAYPYCLPLKAPGATCSASTQCGALFLTPRISGVSVSSSATYVSSTNTFGYTITGSGTLTAYNTACSNNRCCKSSTCTTGCDSSGNCLGDTTSCVAGVSTAVSSGVEQVNTCTVTYFAGVGYSGHSSVGSTYTTDATLCAVGYYGTPTVPNSINTGCRPCPTGATTNYAGATTIDQCFCPAGTFLDVSNGFGSITTTSSGVTTTSITLDFAKCTACPLGSNSSASPVSISFGYPGNSASSSCSYSASTFSLLTSQYLLSSTWSSTQNAFNTVFRESNNGQLGVQSSIFAFVVIIALMLWFVDPVHSRAGQAKMLFCKCPARAPKTPVTPAPGAAHHAATATAQAPMA